jgi:hypothetical protein
MMRHPTLQLPALPSASRRFRRNTREHCRGVAGLITYRPWKAAPLLQNANAPGRRKLFAKEPWRPSVVAPPHGNA